MVTTKKSVKGSGRQLCHFDAIMSRNQHMQDEAIQDRQESFEALARNASRQETRGHAACNLEIGKRRWATCGYTGGRVAGQ